MKIMSNEQLIFSYRDALKAGNEEEWIIMLKQKWTSVVSTRVLGLNRTKKRMLTA